MPRPRIEEPHLKFRRGKWEIVFYKDGCRQRVSTGTEIERSARQALADFEAASERQPSKLTLSEVLTTYAESRRGKVAAQGRLEEAAKAIRRDMGHLRVDQVTQAQWDRYTKNRVTQPHRKVDPKDHKSRPVSEGTLRREFNVLRAALRLAWKAGKLDLPPTLEPPGDSAPRDRYLTKIEARKLLDACITPHVRTFVALAVFTGARKGSILSLTWDRIDLKSGMVDFQEPGRRLTSKRRGIVPMGATLRAEIETAHKIRQTDHVIEYNGKPVPFGLRWSFQKLCQRAGLTWAPTPHHLKHSVASWMAMEGVPIDQAADWLATDPKTLRRVYRKFDPAYLRPVANALEL